MNINQIRTLARTAFYAGQREDRLSQEGNSDKARELRLKFDQSLPNLDDLPPPDWQECQRISDIPSVDEAFMGFNDDATADNATCLVREIITAYLKG